MKHGFIPMMVTVVLVLTSLSECESLNTRLYCPMCAEINDVMYGEEYISLSDGRVPFTHFGISLESNYIMETSVRELQSSTGDLLSVYLRLDEKIDTSCFSFNTPYKLFAVLWNESSRYESSEGAWVSFYDITSAYIEGKFEFVVRDDSTGEVLYDVKKGYFHLPYR